MKIIYSNSFLWEYRDLEKESESYHRTERVAVRDASLEIYRLPQLEGALEVQSDFLFV